MARLDTVNVGAAEPNPYKDALRTGIDKRPVAGRVRVSAPSSRGAEAGSAIAEDFIGDSRNHGGDRQALYAFMREDLDAWEQRLDRELPNGFFGENLTTLGFDVNESRLGETWRIGSEAEVCVTGPRIPCATFRGWVGETGWLKTFTAVARPGAYLSIRTPGEIGAGDPLTILERPDHEITVALVYRALTTQRELLPRLLEADEYLDDELRQIIERGRTLRLG